jgi:hypothetical protein
MTTMTTMTRRRRTRKRSRKSRSSDGGGNPQGDVNAANSPAFADLGNAPTFWDNLVDVVVAD